MVNDPYTEPFGRDDPERTQRSRLQPGRSPDLPAEGRHRRLPARAGDGDDRRWLPGREGRGGERQRAPDIVHQDEGGAAGRRRGLALGDDRHGTAGDRRLDVARAVRLGAGNGEKHPARLDRPAVGRQAAGLDDPERTGAGGFGQERREPRQWISPFECCGVLA